MSFWKKPAVQNGRLFFCLHRQRWFNKSSQDRKMEKKVTLEQEIAELFDENQLIDEDGMVEYSRQDLQLIADVEDLTDKNSIVSGHTINKEIDTLSELFVSWFLYGEGPKSSLSDFLDSGKFKDILSPEQFIAVVNNDAYLPEEALYLLKGILNFNINSSKLSYLNNKVLRHNKLAFCLNLDQNEILNRINGQIVEKEQKIKKDRADYRKRNAAELKEYFKKYRQLHQERIRERDRQYRENNVEKIRKYHQKYHQEHREELLAKSARYVAENHEKILQYKKEYRLKNRDKIAQANRLRYYKKKYAAQPTEKLRKFIYYLEHREEFKNRCRLWRENNPERYRELCAGYRRNNAERIKEHKQKYYAAHKEDILAKNREWRGNNKEKVKESSQRYYQEHREKRREQNRDWINNNPDRRKEQKRRAYENNKEKILEKNALWRRENPDKAKAQQARYREAHASEIKARAKLAKSKIRFRTKTGGKILGLLAGIMNSKV